MRRRPYPAIAAALLAAGALAGCSSSGGSSSPGKPPASGLRQVLDHVSATTSTRELLMYSRPSAAIAANGGQATAPAYQRAIGWGNSLAVSSAMVKDALGFDPNSADAAVNVGRAPLAPSWLIGLPDTPDPKALTKLGARKSGSVYRFGADNAFSPDSALARAVPSASVGVNVLAVDGSSVRFGASSAALALLAPKSGTLGDDKAEVAIAKCLADPLAAFITNAVRSSAGAPVSAVGVGLSGRAGSPPTDQLCVAAGSAADAQHIATGVRTALASGSSHANGQRWSALLKNARVSVVASTVKVTATPVDGRGGLLLLAVQQQDLPGFSD